MTLRVVALDYRDPAHARALLALMDHYASDPMGGGRPLAADVRQRLVAELAAFPGAFGVLAWRNAQPVGLINCFTGYSTFQARPLANIHDVVVLAGERGRGIAQRMLDRVAELAAARGCCKLTLEVLAGNGAARQAYRRFGFVPYQLDPDAGVAEYWEKAL